MQDIKQSLCVITSRGNSASSAEVFSEYQLFSVFECVTKFGFHGSPLLSFLLPSLPSSLSPFYSLAFSPSKLFPLPNFSPFLPSIPPFISLFISSFPSFLSVFTFALLFFLSVNLCLVLIYTGTY